MKITICASIDFTYKIGKAAKEAMAFFEKYNMM